MEEHGILVFFKLAALARPGAPAFLVLFTLDTLARAMLTVVPLQAYALLADAEGQYCSILPPGRSAFAASLGCLIW